MCSRSIPEIIGSKSGFEMEQQMNGQADREVFLVSLIDKWRWYDC